MWNIEFIFTRFCANLIMKCHYRHTLTRNTVIKLFAYKDSENVTKVLVLKLS